MRRQGKENFSVIYSLLVKLLLRCSLGAFDALICRPSSSAKFKPTRWPSLLLIRSDVLSCYANSSSLSSQVFHVVQTLLAIAKCDSVHPVLICCSIKRVEMIFTLSTASKSWLTSQSSNRPNKRVTTFPDSENLIRPTS